jgi:hypothetical protein
MFTVAGDDPETFFPVRVAFVGQVRGMAVVFRALLTMSYREALQGSGLRASSCWTATNRRTP